MTTGKAEGAGDDPGLKAAFAEFDALRQEIVGIRTAQGAIVGLGLTAVGLLLTFGLTEDGDSRLLLAVPPLALIISVLHLAEHWRLHRIGDYIRLKLWPYIAAVTGYPHSWEDEHSRWVTGFPSIAAALLFDGAPPLLFAASGWTALRLSGAEGESLWWGTAAALTTFLLPVAYAGVLWWRRRAPSPPALSRQQ